ncbi:expressed unknown protein [Seminavis robusta]|uniref:Uncharacterized protein n=1 Tax=Seminavis robusta TaxID=568900 RepID=A0A9N8H929_9STRA|nr:expressed unknown protein [Seminavis robusta]|eukprot:Sro177_g077850.1 n/a (256) ;mRNA; r:71125-71892
MTAVTSNNNHHKRDNHDTTCSVTLMKAAGRWGHARSPVPKLLANVGVPDRLWTDTFDQVARIQELAGRLDKSSSGWETARLAVNVLQVAFPIVLLVLVFASATTTHQMLLLKWAAVGALVLYCVFPIYSHNKMLENDDMMEELPLAWQSLAEERKPYFEEFGIHVAAYQWQPEGAEKPSVGGLQFIITTPSSSYEHPAVYYDNQQNGTLQIAPLATAYSIPETDQVAIDISRKESDEDDEEGNEMAPLVELIGFQ